MDSIHSSSWTWKNRRFAMAKSVGMMTTWRSLLKAGQGFGCSWKVVHLNDGKMHPKQNALTWWKNWKCRNQKSTFKLNKYTVYPENSAGSKCIRASRNCVCASFPVSPQRANEISRHLTSASTAWPERMPVWLALGVLNATSSGQETHLLAVKNRKSTSSFFMSTKRHPRTEGNLNPHFGQLSWIWMNFAYDQHC